MHLGKRLGEDTIKRRSIAASGLATLLVLCGSPALAAQTTNASTSRTAAATDAISGPWTGKFDDMIAFTAQLKLQGLTVTGTVSSLGDSFPVRGEWKAATGRLTFSYRHRNGLVKVTGTVKNGVLQGAYDLNGPGTVVMQKAASASGQNAAASSTSNFAKPTPYVLKGTVKNPAGQPIAGVEVWADNTLYANMNALGKTDAQGHFVIPLPKDQLGTWRAGSRYRTVYQNQAYELDLRVSDESAFSADKGAVRDFTLLTSGPRGDHYWGGTVWAYISTRGGNFEAKSVEYTLTPIGPLIDGSAGQVLKRRVDGNTIVDIPIGKYRVTARYVPKEGAAVDMLLKSPQLDEWGPSYVITFRREPQYGVMADLDVSLPKQP
ncbi:MAG: hypothetical protein JWQ08_1638 [Deinococcus sp.]|nr:hypothetical protein [Deinococcus sp.]